MFRFFFVLISEPNSLFSQMLMKKIILFSTFLALAGCQQKQEVYAPVSGSSVKQKAAVSQERAKNLNKLEREQIQDWIAGQKEKFYPTSMNYWVNRENFSERKKSPEETVVSYRYYISDFSGIQLYDQPKGYRDVPLSKFPTELTSVEDALKYMNPGEEVTLLVPSVLAYGTYGDGEKITNDIPLIITLKRIK